MGAWEIIPISQSFGKVGCSNKLLRKSAHKLIPRNLTPSPSYAPDDLLHMPPNDNRWQYALSGLTMEFHVPFM